MTHHCRLLFLGLTCACAPSEYANMGNACPSVSEAFAAADKCDESASTVEEQCQGSRTVATLDGCKDRFDEYYHCVAAWAESGSKHLTLRCGEKSWGMSYSGSSDELWCEKEEDALDFCQE